MCDAASERCAQSLGSWAARAGRAAKPSGRQGGQGKGRRATAWRKAGFCGDAGVDARKEGAVLEVWRPVWLAHRVNATHDQAHRADAHGVTPGKTRGACTRVSFTPTSEVHGRRWWWRRSHGRSRQRSQEALHTPAKGGPARDWAVDGAVARAVPAFAIIQASKQAARRPLCAAQSPSPKDAGLEHEGALFASTPTGPRALLRKAAVALPPPSQHGDIQQPLPAMEAAHRTRHQRRNGKQGERRV